MRWSVWRGQGSQNSGARARRRGPDRRCGDGTPRRPERDAGHGDSSRGRPVSGCPLWASISPEFLVGCTVLKEVSQRCTHSAVHRTDTRHSAPGTPTKKLAPTWHQHTVQHLSGNKRGVIHLRTPRGWLTGHPGHRQGPAPDSGPAHGTRRLQMPAHSAGTGPRSALVPGRPG